MKGFINKLEDLFVAISFTEAGEHNTAISIIVGAGTADEDSTLSPVAVG